MLLIWRKLSKIASEVVFVSALSFFIYRQAYKPMGYYIPPESFETNVIQRVLKKDKKFKEIVKGINDLLEESKKNNFKVLIGYSFKRKDTLTSGLTFSNFEGGDATIFLFTGPNTSISSVRRTMVHEMAHGIWGTLSNKSRTELKEKILDSIAYIKGMTELDSMALRGLYSSKGSWRRANEIVPAFLLAKDPIIVMFNGDTITKDSILKAFNERRKKEGYKPITREYINKLIKLREKH